MSSSIRNSSYIVHKTCVEIAEWGELFGLIITGVPLVLQLTFLSIKAGLKNSCHILCLMVVKKTRLYQVYISLKVHQVTSIILFVWRVQRYSYFVLVIIVSSQFIGSFHIFNCSQLFRTSGPHHYSALNKKFFEKLTNRRCLWNKL